MRKRFLKAVSFLLCLVMLCGIQAHAAEPAGPCASAQITGHSATLDKGSDGYLYVVFTIGTNRIVNTIGASSVIIQRYSFFQWVNEYTFTPENTPALLRTNAGYHSLGLPYAPLFPNAKYRAVVNFYAKSDTMTSTGSDTTNTVP